jgi:predicted metalloenzyme YecM
MELTAIIGDYQQFLASILGEVRSAGFDMADFAQLDHMCYRTSSLEHYHAKVAELSAVATPLGETIVNNRPIAVFRFRQPIYFDAWRIDAIEVPAPKPGVETKEGLEYIEFVIYDDKATFLQKYADKSFDLKTAERGVNPEIAFLLPRYKVKFHLLSLPTVVYLEHKLGFTNI